MILNEKVINYKILDLVNLYNFDFIQYHIKKYIFFNVRLFVGTGDDVTRI